MKCGCFRAFLRSADLIYVLINFGLINSESITCTHLLLQKWYAVIGSPSKTRNSLDSLLKGKHRWKSYQTEPFVKMQQRNVASAGELIPEWEVWDECLVPPVPDKCHGVLLTLPTFLGRQMVVCRTLWDDLEELFKQPQPSSRGKNGGGGGGDGALVTCC